MVVKYSILLAALVVGGFAFPAGEDDMSFFFDQPMSASDERIVGGTPVPAGSWPWMVGLSRGARTRAHLCGASLITTTRILTAAHCVNAVFARNALDSSLRAHVGTLQWNSGGDMYTLLRNITHPNYIQQRIKNDIAFLVTTQAIVLGNNVRTIAINFNFIVAGVAVRVAGWGRIRAGGAFSTQLMQLDKRTFDSILCQSEVPRVARNNRITPVPVEPHIEICTFHSVNHGTCHGDSGSALIRISNNQQVGVVSWGLPCAIGAPDMFVRLSAYQPWIQQSIR